MAVPPPPIRFARSGLARSRSEGRLVDTRIWRRRAPRSGRHRRTSGVECRLSVVLGRSALVEGSDISVTRRRVTRTGFSDFWKASPRATIDRCSSRNRHRIRGEEPGWRAFARFARALVGALTSPVSFVSWVSWRYSVNLAETHETVDWESGMRYQIRQFQPDPRSDRASSLSVAGLESAWRVRVRFSQMGPWSSLRRS
jgi:hypothetical protein